MQQLPIYVPLTFGATVLLTAFFFLKSARYAKPTVYLLVSWTLLQSLLAIAGFYSHADTMTMRFPLTFLPMLAAILLTFLTRKGRQFIDHLDVPTLTLLHVVRIPVEIVLFWLFVHKGVPEAMTFHGRNFDVFSGLSAPFIYYFGFVRRKINKTVIIAWNFICLALLLNVVSTAVLALPARYEQFGFDVPNTALGYFPFVLLPALIVPLVLFSTLVAIRQLIMGREAERQ